MTQEELIKLYETRLEKVKQAHNPNNARTTFIKERCEEFIKFAEEQLEEVKSGRNW